MMKQPAILVVERGIPYKTHIPTNITVKKRPPTAPISKELINMRWVSFDIVSQAMVVGSESSLAETCPFWALETSNIQ